MPENEARVNAVRSDGSFQLAFPFSPPAVSVGPAYEFSINHAMKIDRPDATYSLTVEEL